MSNEIRDELAKEDARTWAWNNVSDSDMPGAIKGWIACAEIKEAEIIEAKNKQYEAEKNYMVALYDKLDAQRAKHNAQEKISDLQDKLYHSAKAAEERTYFKNEEIENLKGRIKKLLEQLAQARGVIEFYGNESNWAEAASQDARDTLIWDNEVMKHGELDSYYLSGKRARAYLRRYPVSEGE